MNASIKLQLIRRCNIQTLTDHEYDDNIPNINTKLGLLSAIFAVFVAVFNALTKYYFRFSTIFLGISLVENLINVTAL